METSASFLCPPLLSGIKCGQQAPQAREEGCLISFEVPRASERPEGNESGKSLEPWCGSLGLQWVNHQHIQQPKTSKVSCKTGGSPGVSSVGAAMSTLIYFDGLTF